MAHRPSAFGGGYAGARSRIAAGPPSGGSGARKPIGVPEHYSVTRPFKQTPGYLHYKAGGGQYGGRGDFMVTTRPRYFVDDEWNVFGSMSSEELVALQRRLEAAGLISKNYRKGFFDRPTQEATRELLGYANQEGASWEITLNGLVQAGERGEGPGGGRAPTYKTVHVRRGRVKEAYSPPDYDSLKSAVRDTFQELVGRPAMDHELVLLANEMAGDYRRRYDAEMDAAQKYHLAQQRELAEYARVQASLGKTVGSPTELVVGHTHDVAAGVAAEQVDPQAELEEWLYRHWGDAIATHRNMPNRERTAQLAQAITTSMTSIMGGGG